MGSCDWMLNCAYEGIYAYPLYCGSPESVKDAPNGGRYCPRHLVELYEQCDWAEVNG